MVKIQNTPPNPPYQGGRKSKIEMRDNFNQPKNYDLVLGNQALALAGHMVLGGIDGVRLRLAKANLEQRIAALKDALNYGQSGLDLLIAALDDAEWYIHQAAYSLLEKHPQTQIKQALVQYITRLSQEIVKRYEAGERNFKKAKFSGVNLPWAELCEIDLSEANLSEAYLNRAYLLGANLSQANLSNITLTNADLSEANLIGANLSGANLQKAELIQANLQGANLREANLSEANLSGANLSEVTLSWANISEANLSGANLSQANLIGAKFTSLDLREANLSGAKLTGINLNQANLAGAYYNDETDFPIGFKGYSQIIKLPL